MSDKAFDRANEPLVADLARLKAEREELTGGHPEGPTEALSRKPNDPSVTVMKGPDGALWVAVGGADVHEVAARISVVCDSLILARPSRE